MFLKALELFNIRAIFFLNTPRITKLLIIYFLNDLSDLVHCTNEPNVSIPSLANLLVERSQNANWVVVFKALITTHHVLAYGNEVSDLIRLT